MSYHVPRRIKTVVETKGAPGEVGGKRAASCARPIVDMFMQTCRFKSTLIFGHVESTAVCKFATFWMNMTVWA